MKNSINQIVSFVIENCNTPSTNDQYTIWSRNGELLITRGSMKFRGDEKRLLTISLANEFAPYSRKYIKNMVEYELSQKV